MIAGGWHARFPMDDASRVGEARRHAARLAREAGFDEDDAGRLALVVTELGTNLLRHAQEGALLLAARGAQGIEAISMDRGPGIRDLPRSMGDGFSTGGTPGHGLGTLGRQADDFEIHTEAPQGTIVLARVRARRAKPPASPHAFRAGGVAICAPGEIVCGDAWQVALDGDMATLVVADGLGHGPDAAAAAQEAMATFAEQPKLAPRELLQSIHARLRSTRGAAVSIFRAEAAAASVRSAGAGNIVARLVSGTADRTLISQHGTAGVQIRAPQEMTTAWPPHAVLVAFSDGIESRWRPELIGGVLARDPALAAALVLRDHCRGRDDATVVVLGRTD